MYSSFGIVTYLIKTLWNISESTQWILQYQYAYLGVHKSSDGLSSQMG